MCKSLHEEDLVTIEKLADSTLSPELKTFLLDFYGEGGIRETYWKYQQNQKMCPNCTEDCPCCAVRHPFCEEPLLEQLSVIISVYKHGHFDVTCDCYETVKYRCCYSSEIPF